VVVGNDGRLPLPWLRAPLDHALQHQRGHALMLHGAAGDGSLEFGLTLAQAWLCEATEANAPRPCGRCASCRLVQSHLHPDLFVLLPEAMRRELGWLLLDDKLDDDAKRKPSRQIRVDDVRALIDWVGRTTARGRSKVALLQPAQTLNLQAASALLKTLEEPPPGTRLLIGVADPAHLLPTVRSRCQRLALPRPSFDEATRWLGEQGIEGAQVLLSACSGRPLEAQALARDGVDAAAWRALPRAVAAGQGALLAPWPLPRVLDTLLKLCHDALAVAVGAAPRYFPDDAMPRAAALPALLQWQRALWRVARHDDHPWHQGLLLDSLLAEACAALTLGS